VKVARICFWLINTTTSYYFLNIYSAPYHRVLRELFFSQRLAFYRFGSSSRSSTRRRPLVHRFVVESAGWERPAPSELVVVKVFGRVMISVVRE